jgi:hypothetical protein
VASGARAVCHQTELSCYTERTFQSCPCVFTLTHWTPLHSSLALQAPEWATWALGFGDTLGVRAPFAVSVWPLVMVAPIPCAAGSIAIRDEGLLPLLGLDSELSCTVTQSA